MTKVKNQMVKKKVLSSQRGILPNSPLPTYFHHMVVMVDEVDNMLDIYKLHSHMIPT